ncbi:MAG: ribbon-helix-helix domain-containing protein [Candidatus Hodarchaeales archaeon]
MTTISVSIDEDLVEWLDQLIQAGVISSRSEAIRGGIYSFIREKLGIATREELREYLRKRQKQPFSSGVETIRSVREEE